MPDTARARAAPGSIRAGQPGERWCRAADGGALVLGTHFATSPGGRVVPDGDVWRFDPVET